MNSFHPVCQFAEPRGFTALTLCVMCGFTLFNFLVYI